MLARNTQKCRMSFGTLDAISHVGLHFEWLNGFGILHFSSNFERCFKSVFVYNFGHCVECSTSNLNVELSWVKKDA